MKIGRLKESTLLTADTKNLLAVLQLIILGVQGVALLLLLVIAMRQNAIANRRPTFAQLVNGDTVYIAEQDRLWRYPEVIRQSVSDWSTLTFNWEGKITGTDQPDPGVKVKGDGKVPTNTWFASVMLEAQFAEASLQEIASLVPAEIFTGQVRSVIIINYLSDPRQIAPGEWEVDLLSTRTLIERSTGASERLAFDRTFTLRAVEIPQSPLGNEASVVEQKIYQMRSAGLEITQIVPFTPNRP